VTSAAGMAMEGLHPVVCLYATFLNRAFDQALLDVALHRLAVTFVLDRAGVTGPDGPSHHGIWDLALLARAPGLRIATPRDPARLRSLLREAVEVTEGPTALRFPKATAGPDIEALACMEGIDVLHRTAHGPLGLLLVAIGATAAAVLEAARLLEGTGLGVTVADPRWAAPVNPALLRLAGRHTIAVCLEDVLAEGGIGDLIAHRTGTPVHALGLPTQFPEHGGRADLLAGAGLTGSAVAGRVRHLLTGLDGTQERSRQAHPEVLTACLPADSQARGAS
jgi:1-deoxy-D-xylulose-5-phosphate synthase